MVREEGRKGPWTEQEDFHLACFVGLFGDRRWDFIAKVSGLKVAGDHHNRTGKSCRLRWVNYLHPGLKRGKMTPQEEKLVLELHAKWGNRWSRIARKLPGRTDNEIKNYWRTHMRKKAQEQKRAMSLASSPPHSLHSASNDPKLDNLLSEEKGEESFYDTGGPQSSEFMSKEGENSIEKTMDDIWQEIASTEENAITPANDCNSQDSCNIFGTEMMSPTTWEYSADSLWNIPDEERKIFASGKDLFSYYEEDVALFSG